MNAKVKFNMRIYLVFFLNFLMVSLYCQGNRKNWSDGPLTWDDFQEKEQSNGDSELKYFIGFKYGGQKVNDTILLRLHTYCYMDTFLSWVNKSRMNEQQLIYNQIIFNLAEWYRRKLQNELDRSRISQEADQILNENLAKLNMEIDEFQKETRFGLDKSAVDKWYIKIKDRLEQNKYSAIPAFEKRPMGIGYNFGFGGFGFTESLGKQINPVFNLALGMDLTFKNSVVFLNLTGGNKKFKLDYTSNNIQWNQGQKAFLSLIDFSYGYTIVEKSKIKLTPFIGLAFSSLNKVILDDEENALRLNDNNFTFGLNTDFRIRKSLRTYSEDYAESKHFNEASIRTRIYVSRVNYFNDLNGFSINFSITYSLFYNRIRLVN